MISDLVDCWRLRKCDAEKQYENSLYEFLYGQLEEVQVTKHFALGRIRADIVVGDTIIIELKNNLDTTAKY